MISEPYPSPNPVIMSTFDLANASGQSIKTYRRLRDKLESLKQNSRSQNTLRAYRSDFRHFAEWCEGNGFTVLPATPEAVCLYLADIQGQYKTSTIERRLASISVIHKRLDAVNPTGHPEVKELMKGIRRSSEEPTREASPILSEHLRRIVNVLSEAPIDVRDRALLLVGFAGGYRRSELARLDREAIEFVPEGVTITLRESKTNQTGETEKKGIAYGESSATCPVRSLRQWIDLASIESGPVFRSLDRHGNIKSSRIQGQTVARVVKRRIAEIGLDERNYSGHSLRAGFVTQAAMNGQGTLSIMDQTGHRSERIVKRYYRNGTLFKNNASANLGL